MENLINVSLKLVEILGLIALGSFLLMVIFAIINTIIANRHSIKNNKELNDKINEFVDCLQKDYEEQLAKEKENQCEYCAENKPKRKYTKHKKTVEVVAQPIKVKRKYTKHKDKEDK